MGKGKIIKIFRIIATIMAVALFLAVIIYLFPATKNLQTAEGQKEFKAIIESSGILGMFTLFILQVVQAFVIILPGEPLEIIAGMCYGWLGGTVFIMVSIGIVSALIFLFSKKYGKKFVYSFCKKEKVEKIENSKLFQNPKRLEKIMLILFLIPGTPKDLLTYMAGLLPIDMVKFILISTIARLPSVISSTLAGDSLSVGDWKMGLLLYAIVFVIVGIIIFIINKFDKNKVTKDAIDTMK